MIVEADRTELRSIIRGWRHSGLKIGLVPTMGYFHQGHTALMSLARKHCDKVVVSLFVNPTQFGPEEDLDMYPRDLDGDRRKAEERGVDLMFCPDTSEMYGPEHQTFVNVVDLTREFCGQDRPVHFQGVTTVVAKLFNIVEPDIAVFGEKDYQQLMAIRRMASDLDFDVDVIGHPIVREDDGIAMSSRNAYLNDAERVSARVLYRALNHLKGHVAPGDTADMVSKRIDEAREMIRSEQGCSLEYLDIVDGMTLTRTTEITRTCRALGALKINDRIRLIDNLPLVD